MGQTVTKNRPVAFAKKLLSYMNTPGGLNPRAVTFFIQHNHL
jgi:hypothetical protein